MNERICIVPDCGRVVHVRGLCRPCYGFASSLVRFGLSTWKSMEDSEVILKAHKAGRTVAGVDREIWFAPATGKSAGELRRIMLQMSSDYQKSLRKRGRDA